MIRRTFKCELDGIQLEEMWVNEISNVNNQFSIVIYDQPGEWKNIRENMRGEGLWKVFRDGPTRCPHCNEELYGFLGGNLELIEAQQKFLYDLEVTKVDKDGEQWEIMFSYGSSNCISM